MDFEPFWLSFSRLGASWGRLGRAWTRLGRAWRRLGTILGASVRLGGVLGRPGQTGWPLEWSPGQTGWPLEWSPGGPGPLLTKSARRIGRRISL